MTSNHHTLDECWEELANAIILQAVDDYRRLLRDNPIKLGKHQSVTIKSLDDFFLSDWFYILTKIDGQTIINKSRREYKNECISNTKHT